MKNISNGARLRRTLPAIAGGTDCFQVWALTFDAKPSISNEVSASSR